MLFANTGSVSLSYDGDRCGAYRLLGSYLQLRTAARRLDGEDARQRQSSNALTARYSCFLLLSATTLSTCLARA
jgi:hypothetical protein